MTKHSLIIDTSSNSYSIDNMISGNFDDLDSSILPSTPELGLLPPVVRYISPWTTTGQAIVVVEGVPHEQLVYVDGTEYSIPVPWTHTLYVLTKTNTPLMSGRTTDVAQITGVGIYFSKTKLETLDHDFYPCFLPGVDIAVEVAVKDTSVAYGYTSLQIKKDWTSKTVSKTDILYSLNRIHKDFMSRFWSIQFQNDMTSLKILLGDGDTHELMTKLAGLSLGECIELLDLHDSSSLRSFKYVWSTFEREVERFNIKAFIDKKLKEYETASRTVKKKKLYEIPSVLDLLEVHQADGAQYTQGASTDITTSTISVTFTSPVVTSGDNPFVDYQWITESEEGVMTGNFTEATGDDDDDEEYYEGDPA